MADLDGLTADTRAAVRDLLAEARRLGIDVAIDSARRSCDEQQHLYDQGRSRPGPIVTNAPGCRSWHVLGRAVDLSVRRPDGSRDFSCEALRPLATFWKARGGSWGGDWQSFVDCPHFQWTAGHSMAEACPDPADCESAYARHLAASQPPLGVSAAVALASGAALGAAVALAYRASIR